MLKCKVCGKEFEPIIEKHYVARSEIVSGVVTAISNSEEKLFDTFDCPHCGCQFIVQERKRKYIDVCFAEEVDDDDECESES